MLTVTDAINHNAYAVASITVVNTPPVITLLSQNFTANQIINAGQTQTLSWTVRNDSGIALSNVIAAPGNGNGGLNYSVISPNGIASWAAGAVQTFSVSVTAPPNVVAGGYAQSWNITFNGGQTLPFSNPAGGINASLTVPQHLQLTLTGVTMNGAAYQDGVFIAPGASTALRWTVRNDSNVNLTNVSLSAGAVTGNVVIGSLKPAQVSTWAIGETKTFCVTVQAPGNIAAGNQSKSWSFVYNGNPLLSIGFNLKTPAATLTLLNSYFADNNAALTDGAVIAQGGSRTINWVVQNNTATNLSNITLSSNNAANAAGQFIVGVISPSSVASWGAGASKTFSVTVSAAADALSGRHTQNWSLQISGAQVNLANNQSLGFSLTTSPLQCGIEASPPPAIPGLAKIDGNGYVQPSSYSQWSCVTDSSSGLMWEVKTQDGGLRDYSHAYSWAAAQSYVNSVNAQSLCGKSDWRLPEAEELLTLVNAKPSVSGSFPQRIINADFFPNTQPDNYWSLSDSAAGNAWGISFLSGGYVLLDETTTHYVRLVRNTP